MKKRALPSFTPAALGVADAAKYIAVGTVRIRELIREKRVDARRDGRRLIIMTASLDAYLQELPSA